MSKRGKDGQARPLKKVNAQQRQQIVKEHFNRPPAKEAAGIRLKENSSPMGFDRHYASTTQLIYSPFAAQVYSPPHLNSHQVVRNVFQAECSNWQVRRSSCRKYDYDQLYACSERRYEQEIE